MRAAKRAGVSPRDTHIIQSLDKGLFVLELVEQATQPVGLNDLKLSLGWDKATIHRILTTLERRGFLLRNPVTKKYTLGLKVYGLYDSLLRTFDIHETTHAFLMKVAEHTGEATHLAVAVGKEIVFIDRIASTEVLSVNTQIGAREPMFCTALGRALLAFVPQAETESFLPRPIVKYTSHTITSAAALKAELAAVREAGFAIESEEYVDGIRCVASPILNHERMPIGAVGVSGPVNRITTQRAARFGSFIRKVAFQISELAGWDGSNGKE